MITSNDCWLKSNCKKYLNLNKECECRSDDIFCIKLFKIDELYNQALLEHNQRYNKVLVLDEDKCDREAYIELKNYCNDIIDNIEQGNNVYIYSSITGNGKTAWAEKILQSYINSIWYKADLKCVALFVSVPRFLIAMKDNISTTNDYFTHIKENVLDANLVVWDDIATKGATQFEHENLLSIIDSRMLSKKSNIFTSNISPDKLEELLGPRLSSRIIGYSDCIQFVGKDKRGALR